MNSRTLGQLQGVEESYHNNIMHAWNSGMEDEEIIRRFGKSGFDRLKQEYGEKSIPIPTLLGYRPQEITDPLRRSHYGLDGPGKQLRDIIKAEKEKREQGVAEGAPELLKKEMPLHRHAEKLLAQNGVSKDDPDYHHHLNNTIKHLRQFGNIG
jgi:hypothetical protein